MKSKNWRFGARPLRTQLLFAGEEKSKYKCMIVGDLVCYERPSCVWCWCKEKVKSKNWRFGKRSSRRQLLFAGEKSKYKCMIVGDSVCHGRPSCFRRWLKEMVKSKNRKFGKRTSRRQLLFASEEKQI